MFVNRLNDTLLSSVAAIFHVYCNGSILVIHVLVLEVMYRFVFRFVFTLGVLTADVYKCKLRHLAYFTTLIAITTHESGRARHLSESASLIARVRLQRKVAKMHLLTAERILMKCDIGKFLQSLWTHCSFGIKSYVNDHLTLGPTCASACISSRSRLI
jgi:hypothetical protein